jgi:hypothetical protein
MSADPQIVEKALNNILKNAFKVADQQICEKIPMMIRKRSEEIVGQLIEDLRERADEVKKVMIDQFKTDVNKRLKQTVNTVGDTYKDTVSALIRSSIPTQPIKPVQGVTGGTNNYHRIKRSNTSGKTRHFKHRANRTKKTRKSGHKISQ